MIRRVVIEYPGGGKSPETLQYYDTFTERWEDAPLTTLRITHENQDERSINGEVVVADSPQGPSPSKAP